MTTFHNLDFVDRTAPVPVESAPIYCRLVVDGATGALQRHHLCADARLVRAVEVLAAYRIRRRAKSALDVLYIRALRDVCRVLADGATLDAVEFLARSSGVALSRAVLTARTARTAA